jgi:hypothetical protein
MAAASAVCSAKTSVAVDLCLLLHVASCMLLVMTKQGATLTCPAPALLCPAEH